MGGWVGGWVGGQRCWLGTPTGVTVARRLPTASAHAAAAHMVRAAPAATVLRMSMCPPTPPRSTRCTLRPWCVHSMLAPPRLHCTLYLWGHARLTLVLPLRLACRRATAMCAPTPLPPPRRPRPRRPRPNRPDMRSRLVEHCLAQSPYWQCIANLYVPTFCDGELLSPFSQPPPFFGTV